MIASDRGALATAATGVESRDAAPGPRPQPLRPLIETFVATYGFAWRPKTRRKHADDFGRFVSWLDATGRPETLDSFDFLTLAAYVSDLRTRPKVHGVWRGAPDAIRQSVLTVPIEVLSANSVNAYVRPLRSFALWLVDEGLLSTSPFRRSRRRSAFDPLLPTEETPPKGASLADITVLERACAGDQPVDFRDRAIVAVLKTTAARNSSVRLLAIGDIDLDRDVIRFRRAKGGKTLEVALHPEAGLAVLEYLAFGRPRMTSNASASSAHEYLFVSTRRATPPRPLTVGALSWMLTRRFRRGGGGLAYFGSHRIRHATATLLANNGMPLDEVSRFLGHSSTAPTRRYAAQTAATLGAHAADAMRRAGIVGAGAARRRDSG
jgi:integrase